MPTISVKQLKSRLLESHQKNARQQADYQSKIDQLTEINNRLLHENERLKSKTDKTTTKDEQMKYLLEQKAKNKTVGVITEQFNIEFNENWEANKIHRILNDVEDLPIPLQEFYYEKVAKYKELSKLNDAHERENDMANFKYLYDKQSLLLEILDYNDPDQRRQYIDITNSMANLLDKKGKINKDTQNNIEQNETLIKMARGLMVETSVEDEDTIDSEGIQVM